MLNEMLNTCRSRVRAYHGTGITEQDTKNAIVEPMLEALGWPKQDLTRVRAEYRHTAGDNPVDYALLDAGRPLVFVEAKALDLNLDERKFVLQVLNYANAAGVDWALLTNGARWALYDVFDRAELSDRKIFDIHLDDASAEDWLELVRPVAVREGRLGRLRTFMKHEAKVHDAVQNLLNDREPGFINLLAERTRLDSRAVATALGTFRIALTRSPIADMMQHVAKSETAVHVQPAGPSDNARAISSELKQPRAAEVPALEEPDLQSDADESRESGTRSREKSPSLKNLTTQRPKVPAKRTKAPAIANPRLPHNAQVRDRAQAPNGEGRVAQSAAPSPSFLPAPDDGQTQTVRGVRRATPVGPMSPAVTGARPSALVAGDRRWPVSSWKTLCVETLSYLSRHAPAQYAGLFDHPDLRGRVRSQMSLSPEGQFAPTKVPGGFVDTNLSAASTVTFLNRAIQLVDPKLQLDWE